MAATAIPHEAPTPLQESPDPHSHSFSCSLFLFLSLSLFPLSLSHSPYPTLPIPLFLHQNNLESSYYGTDEWYWQPGGCNAKRGVEYIRAGVGGCRPVPGFDAPSLKSFDASSLAYSWDKGGVHFVMLQYVDTKGGGEPEKGGGATWCDLHRQCIAGYTHT